MQPIAKPEWRTPDLGGPLGTKAFGERVAAHRRGDEIAASPELRNADACV